MRRHGNQHSEGWKKRRGKKVPATVASGRKEGSWAPTWSSQLEPEAPLSTGTTGWIPLNPSSAAAPPLQSQHHGPSFLPASSSSCHPHPEPLGAAATFAPPGSADNSRWGGQGTLGLVGTRGLPGTRPSEMVTPRLERMAESSRFRKKVHFGGTGWGLGRSLFLFPPWKKRGDFGGVCGVGLGVAGNRRLGCSVGNCLVLSPWKALFLSVGDTQA